jgi:predicted nucleic acid-binding protein
MANSVYVEKTIFSFYHDRRQEPEILARREWTREWWDNCRQRYEPLTSAAVLAELDQGTLQHRKEAFAMAQTLPALPVDEELMEIVEVYIEHRVMPDDPLGDALHLALASFHKFDYLLTWNCKHLANANKFGHIRRVNAILGLHVPELVTPLELIGGDF